MRVGFFIVMVFGFFFDASAHESCLNDINSSKSYYQKSVEYKKKNKLEHAAYSAKMFQLDAYEFKLVCKEKLKLETSACSYEEIVDELIEKENRLSEEGLLKERLLSSLSRVK